jgi:prevent-host-death family protein
MKLSDRVKPITQLKAHAAELIRQLHRHAQPLVITQNGEAKAVLQDIGQYEETQEALALLKILALGNREREEGRFQPAQAVFERLRRRRR